MKTIVVVALDGMMDSSLAMTLDCLRTGAALRRGGAGMRVVVAGYRRMVRTGGGMRITVDVLLDALAQAAPRPDWVVVPGLGMNGASAIEDRLALRDARATMDMLLRLPSSTRIGASCSSVFLLAQAGLLDGRRATMTWWLAHVFRSRHPGVLLDEMKMLVRDGRILTAGSAFAQLDLMLAVLGDLLGTSVAHLCSRYLLIDERPSQARYMVPSHVRHADPTVVAAERWIDEHLGAPIAVTDLAAALAVTPRTLARRIAGATGMSPIRLVQQRRLLQAVHLIETTSLAVEEVAARVGYQDGTALRKIVRREFGLTPAALRRQPAGTPRSTRSHGQRAR